MLVVGPPGTFGLSACRFYPSPSIGSSPLASMSRSGFIELMVVAISSSSESSCWSVESDYTYDSDVQDCDDGDSRRSSGMGAFQRMMRFPVSPSLDLVSKIAQSSARGLELKIIMTINDDLGVGLGGRVQGGGD